MFQKKVVEKIKTNVIFNKVPPENRALYETTWENTVERSRPQMAIWRMRIAFWISKATHTHTQNM